MGVIIYSLIGTLIIIIIILIVIYVNREITIKYLNDSVYGKMIFDKVYGSSVDSLRTELKSICETEKVNLQTAATTLLNQKLAEKETEITTLKSSNLNLKDIEDKLKVCEEDKIKLVNDMDTAVAKLKSSEDALKLTIKTPTPWVCGVNGLTAPIRVNESKNIECMALNGKDCLWSKTFDNCQKLLTTSKPTVPIVPVKCSEKGNDYITDGYWCKKAYYGIGADK